MLSANTHMKVQDGHVLCMRPGASFGVPLDIDQCMNQMCMRLRGERSLGGGGWVAKDPGGAKDQGAKVPKPNHFHIYTLHMHIPSLEGLTLVFNPLRMRTASMQTF